MSAAKRKGTAHEVRVRDYLREQGFKVERGDDVRYLKPAADKDIGDIVGVPHWCLELKDTKWDDISTAMKEAADEATNLGVPFSCVVMHRRGANVRRAYVIMELQQFAKVARLLEPVAGDGDPD